MKHPALSLLAVAILAAGCAHTRESQLADTVSGYYEGNWYGPNPDRPLGELTCTIVPAGPGAWDATFFATYGGAGEYEVALQGHREGERVIFGGDVNLGETAGGIFTWNGAIEGDQFNGTYTSKGINGTFRMTRAEKPE
jgi:hypothetical protein